MRFQQTSDEVRCSKIVEILGKRLDVFPQNDGNALVIGQKFFYKSLSVVVLTLSFGEMGEGEIRFHGRWRIVTERTDSLRHTVDHCIELTKLDFKKGVHLKKTSALYIPVGIFGFEIQDIFIGQDFRHFHGNELAVGLGDSDFCFHVDWLK